MGKIPTQVREQQAKAAAAKAAVMALLRWTDFEYAEFQRRIGCAYLQAYIPRDPHGIDLLVDSRLYWNWWKNRWAERDAQFLLRWNAGNCDCLDAMYRILHNPDDLAAAIYPNSIILNDSYAQMIAEYQDDKNPSA